MVRLMGVRISDFAGEWWAGRLAGMRVLRAREDWHFEACEFEHRGAVGQQSRTGRAGAFSPAQVAAVTAIPGVVFSGSLDGHLRAYSSEEGKILGISIRFASMKP